MLALSKFWKPKSQDNSKNAQDQTWGNVNGEIDVLSGLQQFILFKGECRESGEATAKTGSK